MDEHFTDKSREVLQLAEQESRRLEAGYLGTEHLLLGLIKVSDCVASKVLNALKVDIDKLQLEIENLGQRDLSTTLTDFGIDVSKYGPELEQLVERNRDRAAWGESPQTPRSKNVLNYSKEEAQSFGHKFVDTEHILVGLLREQEGVAAVLLMNHGLTHRRRVCLVPRPALRPPDKSQSRAFKRRN